MAGFSKKEIKTDVLVAGAGISGCAAAQKLQSKGEDYLIVDKNVEPGGLTRSISIGDTMFDYTGHFLHLSKWKTPSEIPFANLNDKNWQIVDRKSVIYLNREWIPAPFQYNLFHLSEQIKKKCIESYRNRSKNIINNSFKDYLFSNFGGEICKLFLYPYNEKILDIDLDKLSLDSVKRFFPAPTENRVEEGFETGDLQKRDYNSKFWYPKNNGIGLLAKGLAEGLKKTLFGEKIFEVDIKERSVKTDRYEIKYKRLISSVPLRQFCMMTKDTELEEPGKKLSYNRVLSLNILTEGDLPEEISDIHWIYIPQKEIPFYRVGIYSNIPDSHFHHKQNAFYVETSIHYQKKMPPLTNVISSLTEKLDDLGWIKKANIRVIAANWIDCAYVHFDHERKMNVKKIISKLKKNDITPIGRYGLWDYISMEDSIESGLNSI